MGAYDVDGVVAAELREAFDASFGSGTWRERLYVRAPGRTEIAGNHTDHEGGSVIAGAVDRYVAGIFALNEEPLIRVESKGYAPVEVRTDELAARPEERNTTAALVRGMAALFAERGYAVKGFDASLCSGVPAGSGLSSSAAFELELAQAMNVMFAKGVIPPDELALMAQRCEREWFGKPCGLMDQAAVALGGIQHMDFSDPTKLAATEVDFDFGRVGYSIVLTACGEGHEDLTDEYAAVPRDMQRAAHEMGEDVLGKLTMRELLENFKDIRTKLGDRTLLRAMHYYREDWLVEARAKALEAGDLARFLNLTRASGASSAMFLQNVSVAGSDEQPAMVAIALADVLGGPDVANRIHGGGFGGTIQSFAPTSDLDRFCDGMEAALGEGSCIICAIDHDGPRSWRL